MTKIAVQPQALADNGWVFHEKCRCQRVLKYKYRNPQLPGYEVEWWVKFYQFRIKEKAKTKVSLTKISLLDQTLKNLYAEQIAKTAG